MWQWQFLVIVKIHLFYLTLVKVRNFLYFRLEKELKKEQEDREYEKERFQGDIDDLHVSCCYRSSSNSD